jgi:hypothetical protein
MVSRERGVGGGRRKKSKQTIEYTNRGRNGSLIKPPNLIPRGLSKVTLDEGRDGTLSRGREGHKTYLDLIVRRENPALAYRYSLEDRG